MLIPSFRAWVSAIRLSILAYLGVMVFPFIFWCLVLLSGILWVASGFTSGMEMLMLLGFAVATLAIGFLVYLGGILIWVLLLKLLWSSPPIWVLPARGLRSNFHCFAVLTGSTLPLVTIFMLSVAAETSFEVTTELEIVKQSNSVVTLIFHYFWLWLLSAAYLLHWFPVDQNQRAVVRQK